MDFVKEIERLQREQSRKLGLKDANAPGAVMPPSAPEPAPAPAKGAGTVRQRSLESKSGPSGAAPGATAARSAAAVVAGMALLVPVAIVGPLVLAVAVLQVRRQIVSAVRAGRTAAPSGPRVPWLVPVLGALVVAAIALSSVFPRGVPLGY